MRPVCSVHFVPTQLLVKMFRYISRIIHNPSQPHQTPNWKPIKWVLIKDILLQTVGLVSSRSMARSFEKVYYF
jgi:hypothetical protein